MGQSIGSLINLGSGTANTAAGQVIGSAQSNINNLNTAGVNAVQGEGNALTSANSGLGAALGTQLQNLTPYTQAGTSGLTNLQSELSSLTNPNNTFSFTPQQYANSPQFAFETNAANQAQERSAAATGGLNTGGEQKALGGIDTGLASTYMDQAFNQQLATYNTNRQNVLSQIAGNTGLVNTGLTGTQVSNSDIGNTAQIQGTNTLNTAALQGNTGLNVAGQVANQQSQIGQAQAAGTLGTAQNLTNGVGGLVNAGLTAGLYGLNGGFSSSPNINTGPGGVIPGTQGAQSSAGPGQIYGPPAPPGYSLY
jgi:hypothetical protein